MSMKRQHMVKIKFSGRHLADLDFFSKSDPFLILSRPSRIDAGYNEVRKTETIKNNLNPDWKVLYIPLRELCDNDYNMKLKIEVFDEDSKKTSEEIGSCQLSLQDMVNLASSGAPKHLKWKMKVRGALYVKECIIENPADSMDNRLSQDSLFSGTGSVSGYPNSRQGSLSGYSQDSISGYPLPPSLQLQGYPQGAGYPLGQGSPGYQGTNHGSRPASFSGYPTSQPNPGYPRPDSIAGYPPSRPNPGYQRPGSIGGYPSTQPNPGYPRPNSIAEYPSSQPNSVYPSLDSIAEYPPSQSSTGYSPSQPGTGYPPLQGDPRYPSSSQSFYPGPAYPSQDEMPDDRNSYLIQNPGYPLPYSPQ